MSYQVSQNDVALAREVAAAQAAAPKAELRTGSSFQGGRWSAATGEVTVQQEQSKVSLSPDLNNATNDNILATARRPTGAPVVGELRLTDYVRHGNIDMTVREAVRFGLLEAVPGGGYRQVASEQTPTAQKEEVKIDAGYEEGNEAFDAPEAEEAFATLVGSVDTGVQYATLNDLTTAGEVSKATLTRIASQMGIVPEQAGAMIDTVIGAMQRQADAAISAAGVADPQEVYRWAKAARSKELAAAMHAQAAGRSTAAYTKLAREFLAAKANSDVKTFTASPRGQALQAQKGHGGQATVTLPGYGTLLYSVALRLGLIK